MIERNQPCPCGSGKKYKKCCGAGGGTAKPAAGQAAGKTAAKSGVGGSPSRTPLEEGGARPEAAKAVEPQKPFLIRTGRGVESERTEAERKKHLRKRIQSGEMRGTLVYNSGAFFRSPNPNE